MPQHIKKRQHINISLTSTGPVPPSINPPCHAGDKITWTNNASGIVTAFKMPTSVSPKTNPAPITVGASTRDYTVDNGSKGSYNYHYTIPGSAGSKDTQNGTIDVS